ncbi:MAG TPA: TonB-dependent receptor [Sphingomicrobium sp.]|nr:TonB-dependent receptor [Sphingomicrobium sp.]
MRSLKIGWKFLVIVAVALLPLRTAHAQGTGTLRGTVLDSASQQPVGGAQVQLVGTNRSTFTDASGVYRFTGVSAGPATVRVQKIGFAQQTASTNVSDGATAAADVLLRAVIPTLSQVVVVGYGSSNRSEVTGAVTTVAASEVRNTPIAGIDAALQGKAAGVQVTQNAGNPGNGISVRVRGAASLTANNQPLWVVDGVPIQSGDFSQLAFGGQDLTAVTNLNPDEIESITVLKDAASAGIYGSRASNGVIMITTKRGIAGANRVTFDTYTGWQRPEKIMPMLTGPQYVEYMAEGARNDGYSEADIADFGFAAGVNDLVDTNWQKEVFRTAPVRNANMAFSGGTGRVKYYLSGSYFGQEGIAIASSYNRSSGRANIDIDATNRLAIKASIALSRDVNFRQENDNTIVGVVANAIAEQPNVPVRDQTGAFCTGGTCGLQYANPIAIATYDRAPARTNRVLANVEGNYNLANWAQFTGRVSGDQLTIHETRYRSPLSVDEAGGVGGDARSGFNTGNRFVGEGFFTLTPWAGSSRGTLTATLGASTERNTSELNFVRGQGFSSPLLQDVGSTTTVTVYDGSRSASNLVSYFGRTNLNLLDRYLASASIRADGSSKFGPNNRYGVFPAFSLGWVITQEPLLSGLQRLGSIKLRGSLGTTGNQGIGNQAYRATFGSANYGKAGGISPNNFGNPDLKWEQTREYDGGFDWTLLDGRIALIGDYYKKKTSNLLVSRPISATSGFTTFTDNVGNIENRGVELEVTTENLRRGNGSFSWVTTYNYSHNRNRVTSLYKDQPIYAGIDNVNSVRVGEPLGAFYLVKFLGVDPQTGDAMYFDLNNDGQINADDRMVVGNPQPTSWGGVTNTFTVGPFDLRAALQFSGGNQIFNGIRQFSDDAGYNYDNKFAYALRRWQKPGDITDEPRASFDGTSNGVMNSSRWIEPGNYTRLQEVTVGMKVPAAITRFGGFQNARVYVSGRNLHTWTHFKGYDPDLNYAGSGTNLALGTNFYGYPLARTWTVGLSTDW